MKKLIFGLVALLVLFASVLIFNKKALAPDAQKDKSTNNIAPFDKSQFSTSEAGSLWIVVNKVHPIAPPTYVPADLVVPNMPLESNKSSENMQVRIETAKALESMVVAAKKDNTDLMLVSGFRSYRTQTNVYNSYVQQSGMAEADKFSARPGTSEHQTGLAVDLGTTSKKCELDVCFSTTPQGQWLAANSYKYGFVLRYPDGKYDVVGYSFEPWHFRFVGQALATELHNQNIQTLEEFFNQVPAKQPY